MLFELLPCENSLSMCGVSEGIREYVNLALSSSFEYPICIMSVIVTLTKFNIYILLALRKSKIGYQAVSKGV